MTRLESVEETTFKTRQYFFLFICLCTLNPSTASPRDMVGSDVGHRLRTYLEHSLSSPILYSYSSYNNNNNNNDAVPCTYHSKVVKTRTTQESKALNEFEEITYDVERWAEELLFHQIDENHDTTTTTSSSKKANQYGWYELKCRYPHKFNAQGQTRLFMKWMKDSRGRHARTSKSNEHKFHPCMKVISTIDAPFEEVCLYLSQPHRYREYNTLLVNVRDLKELTSYSKLCWGQTPKLLFIQPRDFITFCTHKWLQDDTQLILSQACYDYKPVEDIDNNNNKKKKTAAMMTTGTTTTTTTRAAKNGPRAYALRGATYIRPNPKDPQNSTRIYILAHCDCGEDIPQWAVKTAVNILAPIKPFEIMHRIRVGLKKWDKTTNPKDILPKTTTTTAGSNQQPSQLASTLPNTIISNRPSGMAQMGYGSFWPSGGGPILQQSVTKFLDKLDRVYSE